MKRLILIVAAVLALGGGAAGIAVAVASDPIPGSNGINPIVVPSIGAGCNNADKGTHAYLPNSSGLPNLSGPLLTCNGSSWS